MRYKTGITILIMIIIIVNLVFHLSCTVTDLSETFRKRLSF